MRDRSPQTAKRQKVLIAGAGIAGLEAALALRDLAGDRLEIELRDPREQFVFRPFAVGAPYGAARILRQDLAPLATQIGIAFDLDSVASVDGDGRQAFTHDEEELDYDYLVIACGARLLQSIPGAITFWGSDDEQAINDLVDRLRAGELRNVVFTMPSGCNWPLPVYELALLAASELARVGSHSGMGETRLTVVTPEDAPLLLFGRRAGEQMTELLEERGIEVLAGSYPVKFEQGRLQVAPGEDVQADAVVSLPRFEGRRISGVPYDAEGFIPVDEHGRVREMTRVYAAGDVTSFPVKQGGISTQQADAVAEAIAAEAGCEIAPQPFDPILRGVLWTGERPRYLYGRLTGGHGETSQLSEQPLWPDDKAKVIGRYITPFLTAETDIELHMSPASVSEAQTR